MNSALLVRSIFVNVKANPLGELQRVIFTERLAEFMRGEFFRHTPYILLKRGFVSVHSACFSRHKLLLLQYFLWGICNIYRFLSRRALNHHVQCTAIPETGDFPGIEVIWGRPRLPKNIRGLKSIASSALHPMQQRPKRVF